ncbi:MAG: hypothetical protein ACI9RO_000487 [Alteromonas macleodii]|jgi:hypothetical protein
MGRLQPVIHLYALLTFKKTMTIMLADNPNLSFEVLGNNHIKLGVRQSLRAV